MDLNVGNYVRCIIDEDNMNPREFLMGKIIKINNELEEIAVRFYDIYDKNKFFKHIPQTRIYFKNEVERCNIRDGAMAIFKDQFACRIIGKGKSDDKGFYTYYVEPIRQQDRKIIIVNEKDLDVQYDDAYYNPVKQLMKYEFHNPIWYKERTIVSSFQNAIKNSPIGFELLLGSRVYLFPHQMDVIMKGLNEKKCRMLLADEVGLGKTIEACVIYMGLKQRAIKFRGLFIIPKSLANQWKNELSYKFWIDTPIWGSDLDMNKPDTLIVATEDVKEYMAMGNYTDWDICIVDEAHQLFNNKEQYDKVMEISKTVDNILLLSATPIQKRKTEYLSLLKLLYPEKYQSMKEKEFDVLIDKSSRIKDSVYGLVRDLKYFYEDELWDEYIEELEDLNMILKDEILKRIIGNIDTESKDKGLEIVNIALSYISNTYEIEKDIIRNRRIQVIDFMAERAQLILKYQMLDSNHDYYEHEVYNKILDYLENYMIDTGSDENFSGVKRLISSMLSSPWALEGELQNIIKLKGGKAKTEEIKELDEIKKIAHIWKVANKTELDNLDYYEQYPEFIKGRLLKGMDYLDEYLFDKKVVIFTQWTETATIFEEYLIKKVGEAKVAAFHCNKPVGELEDEVDRFQGEEQCRYLICDKLGGEGRNFQIADAVLHLDMPWSPIELEQRIGRLDRIGRDKSKNVLSVVLLADDSIEEDLYNLWDKGLNIFKESLSGIEIALNDVEEQINNALIKDVRGGLKNALDILSSSIERMKREVEKESYYDRAKKLNPYKTEKLDSLVKRFDKDGGKLLRDTMESWANLVGLLSRKIIVENSVGEKDVILKYLPEDFQVNSAKAALFNPPDTKKALARSRKKRELSGTFSVDLAVNREDLIFFSPGDEIFESIMGNANKSYRGRSAAFVIRADFSWRGLIFKWNTGFNRRYLLEKGYNDAINFDISDYLILDQITTIHPLFEESKEVPFYKVKEALENWTNEKPNKSTVHLGKRSKEPKYFERIKNGSNVDWFKSFIKSDTWEKVVKVNYKKSFNEVKNEISKLIFLDEAKEEFEKIINSTKARNIYFNEGSLKVKNINNLLEQRELILKGLKNLNLELDSVAFMWVVKEE